MPRTLDAETRRALAERVRYCHELGIYDFYRREPTSVVTDPTLSPAIQSELREEMSPRKAAAVRVVEEDRILEIVSPKPEYGVGDPVAALKLIREDLGDCTRCKLHKQGRKQIVFGVGNPRAELMFVGEGPGADEDAQGEPFVGRAGQLLNNMIKAMGLRREDVYIANIVKCRPPGNRTPERDECETCSPFLMRQIAVIRPKVVVALGAVAAKNLLAINAPMSELRGRWYDFKPAGVRSGDPAWPGARLAVTYHPAFLLRDPRQKGEAWKDLQMVMKYLGIEPPKKVAE
jgi:uracil-DNA glycosylase family 4